MKKKKQIGKNKYMNDSLEGCIILTKGKVEGNQSQEQMLNLTHNNLDPVTILVNLPTQTSFKEMKSML